MNMDMMDMMDIMDSGTWHTVCHVTGHISLIGLTGPISLQKNNLTAA